MFNRILYKIGLKLDLNRKIQISTPEEQITRRSLRTHCDGSTQPISIKYYIPSLQFFPRLFTVLIYYTELMRLCVNDSENHEYDVDKSPVMSIG